MDANKIHIKLWDDEAVLEAQRRIARGDERKVLSKSLHLARRAQRGRWEEVRLYEATCDGRRCVDRPPRALPSTLDGSSEPCTWADSIYQTFASLIQHQTADDQEWRMAMLHALMTLSLISPMMNFLI